MKIRLNNKIRVLYFLYCKQELGPTIYYLLFTISYLLFTLGCSYTTPLVIKISTEPKLYFKDNSKILIGNFWRINPVMDYSNINEFKEFLSEAIQKDFNKTPFISKNIPELVLYSEEKMQLTRGKEFVIEPINYVKIKEKYNVDYLICGGVGFQSDEASDFTYKPVTDYTGFTSYQRVYEKRRIYYIDVKLILIDLNEKKILKEELFQTSKSLTGDQIVSDILQFNIMSEVIINEFFKDFKQTHQVQTRYLLGM